MSSAKKAVSKLKYVDPTYYMTGGGGVVSAATGGPAIGDAVTGALGMGYEQPEQFSASLDDAERVQWEMYQQARADVAPWREAGEKALGEYQSLLEGGLSQYEMSEAGQAQADYMAEMTSAAAAAQGQFQSERTPLSVASARMGVQQSEYQNRLANYAQLSGTGYGAGTTQAGISQAYSAQATDLSIQQQNLAMAQQAAAQQSQSNMLGGLGGLAGGGLGFMFGGPAGGMAGAQMGQGLGQAFGGFL